MTQEMNSKSSELGATLPSNSSAEALFTDGSERNIAIFSDFDGTIFLQDTGHILFDHHGCGEKRRKELDDSIADGSRSFVEASTIMWNSLHCKLEDGFKTLAENLTIDPGFIDFVNYCQAKNIPINIISAGLRPLLRHVLNKFLGTEKASKIGIVSNDAEISADGQTWKPIWRHPDSPLGHDKARSIDEFLKGSEEKNGGKTSDGRPLLILIGDGVSDLPAAKSADILFARHNYRLEKYCLENLIPFIPYDNFTNIKGDIKEIVDHKVKVPSHSMGQNVTADVLKQIPMHDAI